MPQPSPIAAWPMLMAPIATWPIATTPTATWPTAMMPTAGRPAPAGRVDAANHVHQRQPEDLQPRPVLEARRRVFRRLHGSPSVRAEPACAAMTKAYGSGSARLQCFSSADVKVLRTCPDGPASLIRAGLLVGARRALRRDPSVAFALGRGGRRGGRGAGAGARIRSNILRGDYAGSDSCAGCHAEIHAAWRGSPMHLMTRVPAGAEIRAPFLRRATRDVSLQGRHGAAGRARRRALRRSDVGAVRRSPLPGHARHRRPLPRGLRGRRGGRRPGRARAAAAGLVRVRDAQLSPQGLLGAGGRAAGAARGRRLERDLRLLPQHRRRTSTRCGASCAGPGAPDLQGDGRRPAAAARAALALRGRPAARGRALREARGGRGRPRSGARRRAPATIGAPRSAHGIRELRARFGARQLRRDRHRLRGVPRRQPRARRRAARPPRLRAAQRRSCRRGRRRAATITRAEQVNRVCARCHQVLFSRYPFTWEGEARRGGKPGGSSITSGEARDFLLGGCARQMSCATCHDPHAEDRRADLDRLATPAGNAVCVRCHPQYAPRAGAGGARPPRSGRRRRRAASPATCRRRTWASATR